MSILSFIGMCITLVLKIWDAISDQQAAAKAANAAYKLTQDNFALAVSVALATMRNQASEDSGSAQNVEDQIDKNSQTKGPT